MRLSLSLALAFPAGASTPVPDIPFHRIPGLGEQTGAVLLSAPGGLGQ